MNPVFDPLPSKLPLSDKTRGKLKRELELMPKFGFARNATAAEKSARAEALADLLEADLAARKNMLN